MDKFFKLVDDAIALSHENRKKFAEHAREMPARNFHAEFCTVGFAAGRGIGKTSYIADRARPWDLIIVPSRYVLEHIGRNHKVACEVVTVDEVLGRNWNRGFRERTPRTIYIDEASQLSWRIIDEIHAHLVRHPDQTTVLLG